MFRFAFAGLLLGTSVFSATAFTASAVAAQTGSSTLISATELRQQLQEPAAQHYQQLLQQLRQQPTYQNELAALPDDGRVAPAAREWLLHEAVLALRQQVPTESARTFVRALREQKPQFYLEHDFEGRVRSLPLVNLAHAAQATERWWHSQMLAQQYQRNWSNDAVMATAKNWSQLSTEQQLAWRLAAQQIARTAPSQLHGLDAVLLSQSAPALAATLAEQIPDSVFADALLQHGTSEFAAPLLARLKTPLTTATRFPTQLALALNNPALRSQAWFVVAARSDHRAKQLLSTAIQHGDASAIAAGIAEQGEALLPQLKAQLNSEQESQQLAGVYGLRLLNTPAANQVLKQHQPRSLRLKQELQQ